MCGSVLEREITMQDLLKIISDPERVKLGNIEDKYLSDTLGRLKGTAAALVFPKSTEEVSAVMKFANDRGLPVTPRGAGTNLVGSTVPHGEGIILDFSLMNRVLEIDEDTFTAVVEPGVVLQDFQKLVESRGLFYPPDPGEKTATIGGNISTNAGGMRAVKYGVTRDYVRGLELVLADGRIVTAGTKNVKDASGLSLKHIVIGSEGTLAVITKCILKLVPKPEKSLSVVVPFPDLSTGISGVLSIIRANANPTAIEFTERTVVELGEAAFYGPKLDFMVKDALGRKWQLGTIQVDYNLPERFDLTYTGADDLPHRPIMIHRAPFGSMERFVAVLLEHTGGKFPLWLTPQQVVVLPISEKFNDYAQSVLKFLNNSDIRAEVDCRNEKIGRKIRDNELKRIPFLLIVGEKEEADGTVSVRMQGEGDKGTMKLEEFAAYLADLVKKEVEA